MIRAGDVVILVAAIALIAILGWRVYLPANVSTVRVTAANHDHADYPAWQQRQITVRGPLGETRVEIAGGRARVISSPCTQKICIRSGWLEAAGDATACVPNRVSVALLGRDPRFDAMSF